jgi:hypothetical protein
MVPTGTNLLGLIKHVAGVELGYLGPTFDRPLDEWPPWFDGAEPNADMWGHRRRVARADHQPVPTGLEELGRHHRVTPARRHRPCAVVARAPA